MRLRELAIPGPRIIEAERHEDDRGFFARTYGAAEFVTAGLDPTVAECSVSFNRARATLRGMHVQKAPFGECKLVRCTRGRIWDVAVDVRPTSATFGAWVASELDADASRAMYIPAGFAHGFITLEPSSEVFYQISQPYNPVASVGFRWDDAAVRIAWPVEPAVMSEHDRTLPSLAALRSALEEEK
ncbi:MAG: dTDP-4-dehydrorhamnose 3,5-epimerase [Actinomycetota bacterium]|nr:dTDP-4-dehydrorhamnose 3,5-epimerase [Actinomycetota bacterium]